MNELNTTNTGNQGDEIQHLPLGEIDAWVLEDTFFVPDANPFAVEATEQEITELLSSEGMSSNQLRLSACPVLLKRSGNLILIDAGIGSHVPGVVGSLPDKLAAIGVRPEEISTILITHLHVDHIGGAFDPETNRLLFPKATFYIPEPEINFWRDPDFSHLRKAGHELVELTVRTAQRAIERLQIQAFSFGQEVFPGIKPIALAGHTLGQAGYLVTSEALDQQLLIGGDSMHNAVLHVQHPEWTTSGDSHPQLVEQTRLQLLNRLADSNIRFRCYHFAPNETGFIRKDPKGGFRLIV
jgi:glyoxylase-like metal-dependent hydrolase (beta-lactamase superfamily II)